ncbi:putative membrane-associated kinase regulator 4 [Salvia divinorum]|uniref:Membrane-associated kinase regulator 4 n=1 Tax=Salvia divinorum TaxID=28513 RepID=A0ABD1HW33_SALDI
MLQNHHNSYSDSSSTTSSSSQEDDYIYMEVEIDHYHHQSVDCHSSIFNQSSNNEFEFQQSFSSSSDRDPYATTSPADELFYMGKLLPLHLPPRLEMVHKILHSTTPFHNDDEPFSTPAATTPFESCNISPLESCEVSRELTSDDYKDILAHEKKSWTRKAKMIKQSSSSPSSKVKWTSYIKSLFTKSSGCTSMSQHSAAEVSKAKNEHIKNAAPFGQIKYNNLVDDQRGRHRRSFSGAIKQLSKPKCSTTASSTSNLNLQALKRSIGSSSEVESPIQAAIAHCKRSHKAREERV